MRISTRFVLPVLSLLVTTAALPALAQQNSPSPPYWGPGPWHMAGYGWPMWWMFPFMIILMLVICAVAMIFMGRMHHSAPWHHMGSGSSALSALQILNERFARGEIQKEEYQDKKATLLAGGPR